MTVGVRGVRAPRRSVNTTIGMYVCRPRRHEPRRRPLAQRTACGGTCPLSASVFVPQTPPGAVPEVPRGIGGDAAHFCFSNADRKTHHLDTTPICRFPSLVASASRPSNCDTTILEKNRGRTREVQPAFPKKVSAAVSAVCVSSQGLQIIEENWRRRPDLNRGWRFCRLRRVLQVVESSCSLVSGTPRFSVVFGRSWTEVGLKFRRPGVASEAMLAKADRHRVSLRPSTRPGSRPGRSTGRHSTSTSSKDRDRISVHATNAGDRCPPDLEYACAESYNKADEQACHSRV